IDFADEGYNVVRISDTSAHTTANGTIGADIRVAFNARDAMGRITEYNEMVGSGTERSRFGILYDAAGRVTQETVRQKSTTGTGGASVIDVTATVNSYDAVTGLLNWTTNNTSRRDYNNVETSNTTSKTSYTYERWDDARVKTTVFDKDTANGSNDLWTSTYTYDGQGRLAWVKIDDDRDRAVSFASAPGGQVLERLEASAAPSNPLDRYYFLDGMQIGENSNNGNSDPSRIDYSQSLRIRNWSSNPNPAPFRWNQATGMSAGQFGGSGYDPISPVSNGMQGTDGRVTVRDGDTLQSIAAAAWGDSSLWYMLAEANGLAGGESLAAGTSLIVPAKVTNIRNNASTFEVYDPNRAAGDLSPTAAKPPKNGNKCGMLGAVLTVAVAAVASHFLGPIGGNLVTQGFANLIGTQNGFSWKSLAMSVVTSQVTAGIGASGVFSGIGSASLQAGLTAATSTAVSQGIGVATGLQKKFDFAGVAAAGISAGIGSQIRVPDAGGMILRTMADGIASAATRSVITGTSFGDNIMAVLPDVIGRTVGNMLTDAVTGAMHKRAARHESFHAGGDALAAPGVTPVGAAEPTPGLGGGQVGSAGQADGGIVITGRRRVVTDAEIEAEMHRNLAIDQALAGSTDRIMNSHGAFTGATKGDATSLTFLAGVAVGDYSGAWRRDAGIAFAKEYLGGVHGGAQAYTDLGKDLVSLAFLSDPTGSKLAMARSTLAIFAQDAVFGERYAQSLRIVDGGLDLIRQSMESGLMTQLRAFGQEYVRIGANVNPFLAAGQTALDYAQGNIGASEAALQLASMGRIRALNKLDDVGGTAGAGANTSRTQAKFWTRRTEFNGVRVYQRNDLIDPGIVDSRGRSNLQRMGRGLAPLGPDGKPVNLHHMTQRADSPIAEVTAT
ncbi:MAG TPA: HNH/ENDO VII family nuclease, partial [Allosphingosinicella sp.]|nr:HNH/ENDO VII family nuclease [Allosphingosinicella sp.]